MTSCVKMVSRNVLKVFMSRIDYLLMYLSPTTQNSQVVKMMRAIHFRVINKGDGIDTIASGHDDMSSPFLCNKECDYVDEYHECSISNLPHLFDPILRMPTDESLPSNADLSDSMYIERNNNAIVKARGERNNILLLAKHYRDIAEKYKLEKFFR